MALLTGWFGGVAGRKTESKNPPPSTASPLGASPTPRKKSSGCSFSMNFGTAEETVCVCEGGTKSSMAPGVVSGLGVLSTILGSSGARRRLLVSAATRIGAGFGSVIEIVCGAGAAFFFEALAQPVKEAREAEIMQAAAAELIIFGIERFLAGKLGLGLEESVDFIGSYLYRSWTRKLNEFSLCGKRNLG